MLQQGVQVKLWSIRSQVRSVGRGGATAGSSGQTVVHQEPGEGCEKRGCPSREFRSNCGPLGVRSGVWEEGVSQQGVQVKLWSLVCKEWDEGSRFS